MAFKVKDESHKQMELLISEKHTYPSGLTTNALPLLITGFVVARVFCLFVCFALLIMFK